LAQRPRPVVRVRKDSLGFLFSAGDYLPVLSLTLVASALAGFLEEQPGLGSRSFLNLFGFFAGSDNPARQIRFSLPDLV
jgi:hypothetical protein